ncbi:MAG: class I SAM-dependent RNA methyltransferase [Chloroflexi bacterium]|uniref:23S rRNA (Uracil(1939)-C(5))-methyltransferase RlmD n=1 Tax=Candidatus Thermofonsia Clade 3 bacterium TaxID=2364212 RepID=A0A2M8QFV5_9CHLR|nr:MAG: 23S rRNA (uracil(1939)-C(5))-methyltransferase RlmD [Candidatus Thermofonsia Clade 3 bacterium]RMG64111.1 MAG: class I SAM-dependent RNA methyltransferase [Chloroflexota bacterium]
MTHEVTLTALAPTGEAVGRLPDGRIAFVPFGLPGERVAIRITHERRRFVRAALHGVLCPSKARVMPMCPHFTRCGGCDWQHIAYPAQVDFKTGLVREQLHRLGGIADPPLRPCVPALHAFGYRNRIQLVASDDSAGWGYRMRHTHTVTPIQACPIAPPALNTLIATLPTANVAFADLRLFDDGPRVVGAHPHALNTDGTITLGRWRYFVPAEAFFQVNTAMAEVLVMEALRVLDPQPTWRVLDLYCGVGLFTRPLAERVAYVLGVERDAAAVRAAHRNVAGLAAEVWAADVGEALARPALRRVRWDAVVLDPPRAGMARLALDRLIALRVPRVVYVSCDPATLARDLRRLLDAGYALESVQPLDLFPQTRHVEVVARLSLSDARAQASGPAQK